MRKLSKHEYIGVSVGIVVIALFFVLADIVNRFVRNGSESSSGVFMNDSAKDIPNLIIQDNVIGTGKEAVPGKIVRVHYTGVLQKESLKFDSSVDRGIPFEFRLGAGDVIQGWEKGVLGMKVGGKRILVISPELAYGDRDFGPIPANSTLVFSIELLDVRDK